ncbi:hypothetical protein Pmani_022239 [Petrolisthes manimaculis]|uniref:Uncharacterized protein n=1 Tax=Petrolisthes manimaculis TaxID=1843537 RepID=A0AAE1U2C2_9EUCA|nr:hypothetical protein Pmani_022239 [Petrolisthes manimaculis]
MAGGWMNNLCLPVIFKTPDFFNWLEWGATFLQYSTNAFPFSPKSYKVWDPFIVWWKGLVNTVMRTSTSASESRKTKPRDEL